jgi:hypothetical protein
VEYFQLFFLLFILELQLTHQRANCADIAGQSDAADSFYKDEKNGIYLCGCDYIPESYSKHDVIPPVIAPYVFDEPRRI